MSAETSERELLWRNEEAIEKFKNKLPHSQFLLQAAVDGLNNLRKFIPELTELDNNTLQALINDPDGFIKSELQSIYTIRYGKTHASLGITPQKGLDLVDMPDLSSLLGHVLAFINTDVRRAVDISFFTLIGDKVEINQDRIAQEEESESIFVETELEHKVKAEITNLVVALTAIESTLKSGVGFSLFSHNGLETKVDFSKMSLFINTSVCRFTGETKFELRNDFFTKLKGAQNSTYRIN